MEGYVALSSLARGVLDQSNLLIDRDGIVRWVFVEETPAQFRKTDELLIQLAQLA